MDGYLASLSTEQINEETRNIDTCSTEEMVRMINRQDALVAGAVARETEHIAAAIDLIWPRLREGGRLIYLGAGTSGRLGVLDASECLPTFGVDPDMVQGYIAGGDTALRHPVEGCEDSEEEGVRLIEELQVGPKDAVVGITAMVPDGSGYFWGTGIILTEDGYIVTNTHILDGTDSVTVTLWDDRELEAKLVGADNVSDLAVLKVEAEGLTPAEFCGTAVSVGDAVAALGNPLGEELRGTLTDGIISAINRDVSYNSHSMTLLQTNAAINEGNSGGPLLNMYGQVVGITNMKMMGTSAYSAIEGIGFAIPTSTIQEVVNQLLRNGRVTGRAAIGVTIGPIPEDAAAAYSLPDGLYVVSVAEGSDAAAKGLAEGDVITAIDGQGVTTTAQVGEIIAGLEVGDTITMTVYRNGETFDVEVALVETSDIY